MLADEVPDDGVVGSVRNAREKASYKLFLTDPQELLLGNLKSSEGKKIVKMDQYTMAYLQRVLREKVGLWPSPLVRVVLTAK